MSRRDIDDPAVMVVVGAVVDKATADAFYMATDRNPAGAIESFIRAIISGELRAVKVETPIYEVNPKDIEVISG